MNWRDWDTRDMNTGWRGFVTFQIVLLAFTLAGLGLWWLAVEWMLG